MCHSNYRSERLRLRGKLKTPSYAKFYEGEKWQQKLQSRLSQESKNDFKARQGLFLFHWEKLGRLKKCCKETFFWKSPRGENEADLEM